MAQACKSPSPYSGIDALNYRYTAEMLTMQRQVKSSSRATRPRGDHPDPPLIFFLPQSFAGSGDLVGVRNLREAACFGVLEWRITILCCCCLAGSLILAIKSSNIRFGFSDCLRFRQNSGQHEVIKECNNLMTSRTEPWQRSNCKIWTEQILKIR